MTYLLDTNILIYYVNGLIPRQFKAELDGIFLDSFRVSIITKMEFLGWRGFSAEAFDKADDFIRHADVIEIDNTIADRVIFLRRNHSIKLADAVIAGTAITRQHALVTRNSGDFKGIDGLQLVNPFVLEEDD